ncbi:MAG: helix-turn-helix domain-containing protein [Pseudomonadota bacterium]
MSTYGQYCPLALAAEVLCERWNLLIVSRVVDGCHRFNEIHKGVPKISATLLSSRLQLLEHAGLITKTPLENGHGHDYQLTDASRALDPIIMDLAAWGQAWARDMTHEDLDPAFLLWSMHTRLDTEAMPKGRTVLAFAFSGAPKDCNRFWLVCKAGDVEMCLKDPGFETDLRISADLRVFTEAWRGFRDLRTEIANGAIRVDGPSHMVRDFPKWLQLSALAGIERHRSGAEKHLAQR